MRRVAFNLGGSTVFHGDKRAAGVGAIVGTDGVDDFLHARLILLIVVTLVGIGVTIFLASQ